MIPPGLQAAIERGELADQRRRFRFSPTARTPTRPASRWRTRAASSASSTAALRRSAARAPRGGIEGRVRVWFNPELESRDFMVPGVLALLLLVITANLSSMAIVRERELGTLEQLNVTPLGRWELILGKLLPYALVGFVDVLLVVVGGGVLVRGAAAGQPADAAGRLARCTCSARWAWGCSSRRSRRRSSRR